MQEMFLRVPVGGAAEEAQLRIWEPVELWGNFVQPRYPLVN